MFDEEDERVDRPPDASTGRHTNGVLFVNNDPEEYGEFADDYIDYARSAGTCCRHLNRVRRGTARGGGPDDFDD